MATKSEDIIAGLPLQKQKYVVAKLAGKTGYDAAIAANYAPTTARNPQQIETPDVKAAFSELLRLKIPAKRIVKRISDGMNAKQTKFFTLNGKVTECRDTVDYKERREYASLAAQMGNYWAPKQEIDHKQSLDENTAKRLIDMYDRLGMDDLDWEQRKALRQSHVTLEVQAKADDSSDSETEDSAENGDSKPEND